LEGLTQYNEKLKEITQAANEFLFGVVQQVWDSYVFGVEATCTPETVREACVAFQRDLLEERNAFVAGQQSVLLQALGREMALEPSVA
jgi:hypothetical protein